MNKTNQTNTLGIRFFIVGLLVLLIGGTQVWARGSRGGGSRSGGSRGSIRNSGSSGRSTNRSSSTRSRPSSSQRASSSRDTSQMQNRASNTNRTPNQRQTNTVTNRNNSKRNVNASNRDVNINNSNRNVNVNVNRGGHRHYDWNDARRDRMRFRTVNHLIRAGTYWVTRPKYSTAVVVTGTTYYYWGGMYYVSSGSGYVVVVPPPTAVVYAIPVSATPVYAGSTTYYYYGGTYYVPTTKKAEEPKGTETTVNVNVKTDASATETKQETMDAPEMTQDDSNYEVVVPPVGATVPYLPDDAKEETIGGKKYFMHEDAYYRPFASDGETIYMVVKKPKAESKK